MRDAEPYTIDDTALMKAAWGNRFAWDEKPVYVRLPSGVWCIASTHSMPHEPQHRTDNNFDGHLCIHFPRTAAQVASIGNYATSHQKCLDAGWAKTQEMAR